MGILVEASTQIENIPVTPKAEEAADWLQQCNEQPRCRACGVSCITHNRQINLSLFGVFWYTSFPVSLRTH